jgi:hypothetical protein
LEFAGRGYHFPVSIIHQAARIPYEESDVIFQHDENNALGFQLLHGFFSPGWNVSRGTVRIRRADESCAHRGYGPGISELCRIQSAKQYLSAGEWKTKKSFLTKAPRRFKRTKSKRQGKAQLCKHNVNGKQNQTPSTFFG